MDRQFSSPRAVAASSPEELQRALRRVLAGLDGPAQFLYEAEFEYANGRKAPLLMVGALRGAWRDYMRRNAASARFCAGDCHPRRDDAGRLVLELRPARGRARGGTHARAINAALMRGLGEVRFVDAPGAATAPAGSSATPRGPAAVTGAAAPDTGRGAEARPAEGATTDAPAELGAAPDAAALLAAFNDFKSAPSAQKLESLQAGIVAWRAAGGGGAAAAQVEKLATVLAQKGRAYVAARAR